MVENRVGRRSFATLSDQTVFSGTKTTTDYVAVDLFLYHYVVKPS